MSRLNKPGTVASLLASHLAPPSARVDRPVQVFVDVRQAEGGTFRLRANIREDSGAKMANGKPIYDNNYFFSKATLPTSTAATTAAVQVQTQFRATLDTSGVPAVIDMISPDKWEKARERTNVSAFNPANVLSTFLGGSTPDPDAAPESDLTDPTAEDLSHI